VRNSDGQPESPGLLHSRASLRASLVVRETKVSRHHERRAAPFERLRSVQCLRRPGSRSRPPLSFPSTPLDSPTEGGFRLFVTTVLPVGANVMQTTPRRPSVPSSTRSHMVDRTLRLEQVYGRLRPTFSELSLQSLSVSSSSLLVVHRTDSDTPTDTDPTTNTAPGI